MRKETDGMLMNKTNTNNFFFFKQSAAHPFKGIKLKATIKMKNIINSTRH